jgi:cytochrome P450
MIDQPDYLTFDPDMRRLKLDPHEPRFFQNPYEAYAFLHAVSPVFYWEEFGFWCFIGFEDVSRLLRDRNFGRQNPEGAPSPQSPGASRGHVRHFDVLEEHSLLEREPPVHTRLRTLVTRAFVSRQVERLKPRLESLSHELIDRFEHAGSADLITAYATPLPVTIIADMLGIDEAMGPQLLDWSHAMVAMYAHGRTREIEDRANLASQDFAQFIRDELKARRSRPGDDLLSLLALAESDAGKLTQDELVSTAGHEATVHQTGNAVKCLLETFDDPAAVLRDDIMAERFVEEALRFDAPLHMFTRYANSDIDLPRDGSDLRIDGAANVNSLTISKGEMIGLMLGAANRDPKVFCRANLFDPDRSDQKNVTFGAGIHFCIGAPLARLELQVSLKVLVQRLPNLKLTKPPKYRDSYHFHGLERLEASW